jgi:hypothetical protein
LDKEVKRATARRDKAAAILAAEDAALEALLKAQAELFEAVAEEHRNEVLHDKHNSSTLKHVDTSISQKTIGRPLTSKHPFPARCVELHGSVRAAAKALGFKTASTIRSWYADGPEGRPIPEDWQAKLAKAPWNIPARAWRNRPSR